MDSSFSIADKTSINGNVNHYSSLLSDEDLMPVKLSPSASSTPSHLPSLCNEIRNTIVSYELFLFVQYASNKLFSELGLFLSSFWMSQLYHLHFVKRS